jgi:hypothetical protein
MVSDTVMETTYSVTERAVLWTLAVIGGVGLNTAFLYGLLVEPAMLTSALANPLSLAFIVESLLLMGVFAHLLTKWGVSKWHGGWFVLLSLLGGMAFALPIVLLWKHKGHR